MNLFDVYPLNDIEIVKASGSTVWDEKGQEYLDLYGGHAVISIGHTHPHYVKRLTEQLAKVGFYSNSVKIPLQVQLSEKLGQVSGKTDYQLFLCNSGAEANENALKLASFYNGRKKIVAFKGAFHGRTSLAVSATDNPKIIAPVNETTNIDFLPFNDEEALKEYFNQNGQDVAAVIIEGIQGVGGIQEASKSFLQLIRSLCDQYNAVYIADSVQCGYGRTGLFYSHDYAGVQADIYTMAKGMGNGFPVAGISIAPKFKPWHGMLGTTFGGNHLACAAALSVLEIMEQDNLMENAAEIGEYLIQELRKIEGVKEVRGRGLMIGIDLPAELSQVKKNLLFQHHIFTGEAKPNVIRLLPALNLSKAQADQFLDKFKIAIKG
ncbi:aspartate aminotransferase family protein [Pedobacter antarcticus]|uniref:Acetylornithine aminotransferase n=2 Tax=Pedobacter antarcticus TaxID=34086 RepID=A0A081PGI3_9SPHI|nr:aspartate aminotransferase family protein [Pedobacter antarcticus]KEQ29806.1 acetylornithine aminotransferase [Pedobacter antarcticus 4BY]SDM50219.1 acetylornithine aminotransferase [Pedobacter antarcticus]SFE67725.1 acetylornithine aminotransferase [Pedobacter antarcticus]